MPRATVGYLNSEWKLRSDRPRVLSGETRRANTSPQEVDIEDARPLQDSGRLDLDTNGFVLAEHRSAVSDFRDPDQIKKVYVGEMTELLQGLTGADHLFWFNFSPLRSEDPDHFLSAYSLYMHCDYSPKVRNGLIRALLQRRGSELAHEQESWDFAWFNLWRPVDWDVETRPLTIADATTIDPDDVLEYHPAEGALAAMPVHDAAQRLYYFPGMRTDEVAVFKQLDTRNDQAQVCPHTSFDDPDSHPDGRPRRSFELRLMCAFAR